MYSTLNFFTNSAHVLSVKHALSQHKACKEFAEVSNKVYCTQPISK